jgi:tRNA threonylcarbamoyladenosine biosynthesis protein TsaE
VLSGSVQIAAGGVVANQPTSEETFIIRGEQDTARFGRALGVLLAPGDVVGLCGDLGAGKTTLTRAIARGAGVPPEMPVNSPTFTILNLYDGAQIRICHLDLYRLGDGQELEGIGLQDLLDERTALVVEWFELFPDAFDSDRLQINIERTGEAGRLFHLTASGEISGELLAELRKALPQGQGA